MQLAESEFACNKKLQRRHGLFGMVDMNNWSDAFAENIKDATITSIKNACTVYKSPPRAKRPKTQQYVDMNTIASVFRSIEIFDADAASDEQLAGNMLKGAKLDEIDIWDSIMPNMVKVRKDTAHASRRIGSRSWTADPYLQNIHMSMVGRGCFIQKLQHSGPLSNVFNCNIRADDNQDLKMENVKDMGAIKPRWESAQKSYRIENMIYY